MKLKNVGGFNSILDFIADRIKRYSTQEKTMKTLHSFLFSEKNNVFAEIPTEEGYEYITYGQCERRTVNLAKTLNVVLSKVEKGSMVGLYMNNSLEWIEAFWALLMTGYKPLLMNLRLNNDILNKIIKDHKIEAVISDSKTFETETYMINDLLKQKTEGDANFDVWGDEVYFMSSGTTNNVKLCAYNGENFYYQVCDSVNIINKCPRIIEHYEGELKHLAILPLYHVFGFIAMYIWFSFFQRRFVFLKDLHPQTLLETIQDQKVTHIFAVPLVWERVYKGATKKIKALGEETYASFNKLITFSNNSPFFANLLLGGKMKEIRSSLLGESIKFLISGGSGIQKEILEFFNGLGYHLVNGFGMTEVGITSVELSTNRKDVLKASIGKPFASTEYLITDKKELMIKSKTRACKIIQDGVVHETDYDSYFNSNDVARVENGSYYIEGRQDDLIVCKNGENLNPEILEKQLIVPKVDNVCLFNSHEGQPTLIVSVVNCFSKESIAQVQSDISAKLVETKLTDVVSKIYYTTDKLLGETDFKVSRKKIALKLKEGKFKLIDNDKVTECDDTLLTVLEAKVRECFAQALQKDVSEIGLDSNFFSDLGGSSLDYFALVDLLKESFDVEFDYEEENILSTVREMCEYIKELEKNI